MRRLALVAMVVLGACQSGGVSDAVVELDEFSVTPTARTFEAGAVELTVRNAGDYGHTLVVTDGDGQVVSAGELLAPSDETKLRLDLPPGEYQFTCRIVGQDGEGNLIDHYEEGMMAAITVERS